MDIELKPCPFCNREAKIADVNVKNDVIKTNLGAKHETTYYVKIICKSCGAQIEREWSCTEMGDKKIAKYGETVFEAWNRRIENG